MSDKEKSNNDSNIVTKECRVCGDTARGFNFNVITCMSCKAFFRRNARKKNLLSLCQFEKNCSITKRTRSYCSPCRLQKCLTLGMNPDLIQHIPKSTVNCEKKRNNYQTDTKKIQLPTPLPLSLLRNDRSTLTSNEWTLLSNILHAFNEKNTLAEVRASLTEFCSLPPKLRVKPVELFNVIRQLYKNVGSIIEHSTDYSSLPIDHRQVLIKNNLYIVGMMNALFLSRELHLFENTFIFTNVVQVYGSEYLIAIHQNAKRYDPNGILVQILIFILAFSSNCSTVRYDSEESKSTMFNSMNLVSIQHVYGTMLWKYLVYLHGYDAAALRFSALVKSAVDLISTQNLNPHGENRNRLFYNILEETEKKLVISG